ncbi:hypothetical protein [Shewanella algicola]|uniref:hypothetical protein n=1 Tax=Shewanella algicola TaxID=640633 RepID=UPI0024945CF1|nr:hypothetical protein [Shewanella algicola]
MTEFINRRGSFNYTNFVKYISETLTAGQVIHPRCVRETRSFGNTDAIEKAEKSLRMAFDLHLGSANPDFKRKRSQHGGYEYLRL